MSSLDGADDIAEETEWDSYRSVTVHEDTVELINDLKPEYMSRSAFAEGVIWKFYGHLNPESTRRLSLEEHQAIHRLKRCGVDHQVIGAAFGIQPNYIRHVGSKPGEGEHAPLDEREADE